MARNNVFTYVCLDIPEHFAAIRKISINSSDEIVQLEALLNYNGRFDSKEFSPSRSGFYWFHVSTGLQDGLTKIRLIIGNRSHLFVSESLKKSLYVMSCDLLMWMKAGESAYLKAESPLYSDESGRISFVGFYLENIMSHFAAVQMHLHFVAGSMKPTASFNRTMAVNWAVADFLNGSFQVKAPKTGIYILAVNFRLYADQKCQKPEKSLFESKVVIEGGKQTLNVLYQKRGNESSQQFTFSLIYAMQLQEDDNVKVIAMLFQPCADVFLQLMLYDPIFGSNAVWAVTLILKNGAIQLKTMLVKDGVIWNKENNAAVISVAGIYYISITAVIENLGFIYSGSHASLSLLRNNLEPLIRLSLNVFSSITFQQSSLVKLMANDILHVEYTLDTQTTLYFCGILVTPLQ